MNEKFRELLAECDNNDLARFARMIMNEFQKRNLDVIVDEELYEYWKSAMGDVVGIMLDVSDAQL